MAPPAEFWVLTTRVDVGETVYCAEATLGVDALSVAVTLCAPAVEPAGTVKVAEKSPTVVEVTVDGVVVMAVPLYLIVIAELGAKPVPLTVTVAPAPPDVGLSVIPVANTVICTDATFVPSEAATVCVPTAAPVGTAKVTPEKEPLVLLLVTV